MRSAPTLKIWMTPFASVAMLEKFALLKIASCSAPVLSSAALACLRKVRFLGPLTMPIAGLVTIFPLATVLPLITDAHFRGLRLRSVKEGSGTELDWFRWTCH